MPTCDWNAAGSAKKSRRVPNCPVHCYQKARREQVKVVMRYAGPRMVWEHPVMSIRHWLDGFRKAPEV